MSEISSLHRTRRAGSSREQALKAALGVASTALALAYAGTLAYLLVRGGSKIAAFTLYPVPLRASTTKRRRALVAALVFGGIAWAVVSLVRFVLERAARWKSPAPARRAGDRAPRPSSAPCSSEDHGTGLAGAVAQRDPGGAGDRGGSSTVYFALLSTAISPPIGVGARQGVPGALQRLDPLRGGGADRAFDTPSSLPSIRFIRPFFGFLVFVVQMRMGHSLFAGAFVLALLNLLLWSWASPRRACTRSRGSSTRPAWPWARRRCRPRGASPCRTPGPGS